MAAARPLLAATILLALLEPALGQTSDLATLYEEGIAARNAGQPDRAIERFRKVLAAEPKHVDARVQLGFALTARRQFDEARRAFDRVLDETPDYHDARLGLARIAYFKGDLAEASRELDILRRLAPDHEEAQELAAQVARAREGAQLDEAQALRRKGRFAEAERIIRALLVRRPRDPDLLIEAGTLAAFQGRFDAARESFDGALRARPHDTGAALGLARLDFYANALPRAQERVDEVLSRRPDDPEARSLKASLRLAGGDPEGAERDLRRLAAEEPKEAGHQLRLGDALRAQERDEEARTAYEAARRIDPASAEIASRLALKARPRWQLDLDGGGSDLGGPFDSWSGGRIGLAYRVDRRDTVSGAVETQRRFGQTETTVEARLDRRWADGLWSYARVGGTPDAGFRPAFLTEVGAAAQIARGNGLLGATVGLVDLSYARYAVGETKGAKIGLQQYAFGGRFWLTGQLVGTLAADGQRLGGYALRADWLVTNDFVLSVGYSDAPDVSDGQTIATRALFGSMSYVLNDAVTLRLSTAREERKRTVDRTEVVLGLSARF